MLQESMDAEQRWDIYQKDWQMHKAKYEKMCNEGDHQSPLFCVVTDLLSCEECRDRIWTEFCVSQGDNNEKVINCR